MTRGVEKGNLTVRRVVFEDMEGVFEVADANHIKSTENPDSGFLVSGYTLDDYKRIYTETDLFYVVEEEGAVRGFILGALQEDLDYSQIVNKNIRKHADSAFLVVRQICVDPHRQGRGYGKALFEKIIMESVRLERGIHLSIVLEPYNKASVNFHAKLGFSKAFEVVAEDGILRGVYHKPYR